MEDIVEIIRKDGFFEVVEGAEAVKAAIARISPEKPAGEFKPSLATRVAGTP